MDTDETTKPDIDYNEAVATGEPLTLGNAASDGASPKQKPQLLDALVRRLRVTPPSPSQRMPPTRNRRVLPQ